MCFSSPLPSPSFSLDDCSLLFNFGQIVVLNKCVSGPVEGCGKENAGLGQQPLQPRDQEGTSWPDREEDPQMVEANSFLPGVFLERFPWLGTSLPVILTTVTVLHSWGAVFLHPCHHPSQPSPERLLLPSLVQKTHWHPAPDRLDQGGWRWTKATRAVRGCLSL